MRRIVTLCLLLSACFAHADTPSGKLVGLWGSERLFGPAVSGRLTLDGRSGEWLAEVAGFTAPVQHDKDGVSFSLPGQQGSFRGTLSADGKRIEGFWIQPAGIALDDPYATPMTLDMGPDHVWHGDVRPLADRVSLYLVVQRADDGSLKAFIRNPEFNFGMHRAYKVALDGNQVVLDDAQRGHDQLRGSYDPARDLLTLDVQGTATFEFTRRDRDHAVGFYPRTPAAPYAYREPVQEDDGWSTSDLAGAGLDPKPLATLVQEVLDTQTDWYTAPYVQSILVARHGRLAMEEYFYGFDRERTHDSRSSGKTLTGTLVGMAIDHGAKFGVDTPVLSLLPEYRDLAHPDPRKQRITVQDLLTMDSGLACDDNDDDSPGNEDTMQGQHAQPDWYKYILDVPMQDPPGDKKAVYCTAGINLLGAVLRDSMHRRIMDLFQEYYAAPLHITDYHLNLAPNGDAYLGGGIYLRPRDMLKLGQLYLDGGVWNGTRVLSKSWVDAATRQHSYFPANDYTPGHGYGYTWHLFKVTVGAKTYDEYMAQGNGGQLVMAVPALDLAVVITAGNYGNFPTWRKFFEDLMPKYLIPAAGG